MTKFALGLLLCCGCLTQLATAAETSSSYELLSDRPIDAAQRAEIEVEAVQAGTTPPQALPVRVIVTGSDGHHPDGSGHGVYSDGRFFADGTFVVAVPAGATRFVIRRGPNWVPLEMTIDAKLGRRQRVQARLTKWHSPEEIGWFAGDNHVHAQHDAQAAIKTSLAYTALQARANGLSFVTEAGSAFAFDGQHKLDTPGFLLRYAPEIRPGPFVGHRNTPGLRTPLPPERLEQLIQRPLPTLGLLDVVHADGGAVIYTHPLTPPHQLHWMGSPEVLSHAVLGQCADAFDIDSRASEQLWFAVLNLGNKVACSASTDAALGRLQTASPGDRRVYCQSQSLTYEAIVRAIRDGKTIATNGGPIFPILTLNGHGVGETLKLADSTIGTAKLEVRSLYPLKKVELFSQGERIKNFATTDQSGRTEWTHALGTVGARPNWLVARVEDDRGHWAITSPIYFEPPTPAPRPFASAVLLEISNHTRFIELRPGFFAHLITTVDPTDNIARVDLLKDGVVVKSFVPTAGNQIHNGKIPVTSINGDYAAGWVWHQHAGRAVHLQADWPMTESGRYSVLTVTNGGQEVRSNSLQFSAEHPASRAISAAKLIGGDTRFELSGYGEEQPLADIKRPFVGDHWWYPQRTWWRIRSQFRDSREELTGGGNVEARELFSEPTR